MTNYITNFLDNEIKVGYHTGCKFGNDTGIEQSHYDFIKVIGKQSRIGGDVYLIENNDGIGIATLNPEIGHLHCTNFVSFGMRSRDESIRSYGFYEPMTAI